MMQILIADDENLVLSHLQAGIAWRELGLEICAMAHNGQEALEYLLHHPVDILLPDIRMPGMDGLELCRQAREHNPVCPLSC